MSRWIAKQGKKGCIDLKAQALAWATKELARCRMLGWKLGEAEYHVFAEVGRRWNIGCAAHVERELNLSIPKKGTNMKMRRPMPFHVKVDTIPGYAWCPNHGAEAILFNTVTRFYQCQAVTEEGEAAYSPLSTIEGVPVCTWQKSQRQEAANEN